MISLNEKTQALAVSRVKKEMAAAEKNVESWKSFWTEQCQDAYCLSLRDLPRDEVLDMESKYYDYFKLTNAFHPETRVGAPLRTATLEDFNGKKHTVEFGKITWYGMRSNYSTRYFIFQNDGTIGFSKGIIPEKLLKRKSRVSYDASYNVLTDEFCIGIIQDQINCEPGKDRYDTFTVSLEDNTLIENLDGIEIRIDLCTNEKQLIIWEQYKNSPIASLSIEEIESRIMRMVKCIKGELPLPGLVERIDNYLELMQEDFTIKEPTNQVLELAI